MHSSKKHRYTAVLAMLLFAFLPVMISCSSDEVGTEEETPTGTSLEIPIGFRDDAVSRAAGLSTAYDNFCVRAVKENADGTNSLVMPNYVVKHIGGKWVYDGESTLEGATQFLKYWDLSASSYTFTAVAPASADDSTVSTDDDGVFSIAMADLSTNWMIARTIRLGVNGAAALLDYDDIAEDIEEIDKSAGKKSAVFPTPSSSHADVPLNFHRILAKVVIKAYADGETSFTPLEVGFNNIGIAPATYSLSTGWTTTTADYQQLYKQNTLITNEQNSRETALQLTEFYVIPQQSTDATGHSLVKIKVKTDNDDDQVSLLKIPTLWEPNYTYTYYLKFDSGETGEIILFDVVVEPMAKGGEAEDKQTNW